MAKIERIVLHVGRRKTGSTSIQATLKDVDTDGFRYAKLGVPNHSGIMLGLVPRLFARRRDHDDASDAGLARRLDELRRKIVEGLGDTPARTVLFSAESLEKCTEDEAAGLAEFFRPLAQKTEVIAFARSPIAAQLSLYQENLKHGFRDLKLSHTRYRRTLEPFLKAFGGEAVTILPFDTGTFIEGSLLKTFMAAIGEPDIPYAEVRRNEAMSEGAAKLLYLLSGMDDIPLRGPRVVRTRRRLWQHLIRYIHGPKLSLPDNFHPLLDIPEDVAWLRAETGIDFSADLSRMNPDADAAARLLAEEMGRIPPAASEQLAALVEKLTGERCEGEEAGLRRLYDWLEADSPSGSSVTRI